MGDVVPQNNELFAKNIKLLLVQLMLVSLALFLAKFVGKRV